MTTKLHSSHRRKLHKFMSTLNVTNFIVVCALIMVLTYGTCGVYYLRHDFVGIKDWSDAFYYTVVVFSTLGDNSILPLTDMAKYFIISMVLSGFGTFAMFFSVIFYQIVNRLNKIVTQFRGERVHMKDHIILCGYSILTELLMNNFLKNRIPFLLIDNAQHPELNSAENGNFMYVSVCNRQDSLINANIEFCRSILAVSDSDSENLLAAVNANMLKKKYNASFKIVVRVLYEEHIEIAKLSGATDVISPTLMAANAILNVL